MEGQKYRGLGSIACLFVNKKYTCAGAPLRRKYTCAARSRRVMGPLAGAGALLRDKKAHCLDADLTTQTNRGNDPVD